VPGCLPHDGSPRTLNWNPEHYGRNARFVSELGLPVVALLAPQPGERILDLGCGDGALTRRLVELGCSVVGVDASAEMIEAARELGLDARVADGQSLGFEQEFDAVFSNAALHWMPQSEQVIQGVWRALKPGGRFVAECGGEGNVATIVAALEAALTRRELELPHPWFFPTAADYRSQLEAQGFVVDSIERIPRPTPLPGDVGGWLETFAQPYLARLPESEQQGMIREVVEALRPVLCDSQGSWTADYVRLRFAARKPRVDDCSMPERPQ
jgi:trans-aconitate methyltransferase